MDYKNKYLKYKQKYLNLKKMIGGGIEATYTITGDQLDQLTVNYKMDGVANKITYTILNEIGSGGNGIVSLIRNNKNGIQYIFKKGIFDKGTETFDEGVLSNLLENILDDDMLVLYQGTKESDFLISKYNGKDLYKEFKDKKQQLKNQYATVTIQLLDLLYRINSKDIFHNDIKLANITFKNGKVYLIDFGLLSQGNSQMGTLISMSYNGVIAMLPEKAYKFKYPILQTFLKHTDMVGFFYCCIDLLFLTVSNNYSFSDNILLKGLNILNYSHDNLNKLFELFYFILPESNRKIDILNDKTKYYTHLLPSETETLKIFSDFPSPHTNLFRFMAYIYNKIKYYLIKNPEQDLWYKKFLKHMSACFLPTFNYDSFKLTFNKIVLTFSALSDDTRIYSVTEKKDRDEQIVKHVKNLFSEFNYFYYNNLDKAKRNEDPNFLRILRITYYWLKTSITRTENDIKAAIAVDDNMIQFKTKSFIDDINEQVLADFNMQTNKAEKKDRDAKILEQVNYLFEKLADKFIYLYYNELDYATRIKDTDFLRILRISYHWIKSDKPTKKQITNAIDNDDKMIAANDTVFIENINKKVILAFDNQTTDDIGNKVPIRKKYEINKIVKQVNDMFTLSNDDFIKYISTYDTTRLNDPDFLRILRISYYWLKDPRPTEDEIIKAIDEDDLYLAITDESIIAKKNKYVVQQFKEKAPAEKAAAEKVAGEKVAGEKVAAEKVATEKAAAEKAAAEKVVAEKVAAEKAAAEKVAAEKAAAEKVAAEKVAAEKAAAEKVAAKKAAAEKAAAEKAAAEKTDIKNHIKDLKTLSNKQFNVNYNLIYDTNDLTNPDFLHILRVTFYWIPHLNSIFNYSKKNLNDIIREAIHMDYSFKNTNKINRLNAEVIQMFIKKGEDEATKKDI